MSEIKGIEELLSANTLRNVKKIVPEDNQSNNLPRETTNALIPSSQPHQ
jgi:hypothetical protein